MPQTWETMNATWVVAVCFIALLVGFGAHNKRTGWKKQRRAGAVTELLFAWLKWNRSLAPIESEAGEGMDAVRAAAPEAAPLAAASLFGRRGSI